MTETETRHAAETLTWCLTTNGYADAERCADAYSHDHHDIVVDQHGEPLFRVWPIGTTFTTSDGHVMRLRRYDQTFADMDAAENRGDDYRSVPERPVWNGVAPNGGAFSTSAWLPEYPGAPTAYAASERPSVGSLYVRPNGEAWRLFEYRLDMREVGPAGENVLAPSWMVTAPHGTATTIKGRRDESLPNDARLVWAP